MKEAIDLFRYENELLQEGYTLIGGMDEVGRGPLAGPVTVACCVMDLSKRIPGVNDSKKLSEKKREKLYPEIIENTISYSVVSIDNEEIDRLNILNATKKAMKKCVVAMVPQPHFLLVDAVDEDFGVQYKSIIHGDALSYSIAAASIIAKVTRDEMMKTYDSIYPEYGFAKHKGYGTKEHIEAIKKYGPCPIHRKTFIKNFV
ncbi:MAG: ribonuclease HII [Clostridia bacterium]|nr:ribonuclease HII [Clostridia bacterium]